MNEVHGIFVFCYRNHRRRSLAGPRATLPTFQVLDFFVKKGNLSRAIPLLKDEKFKLIDAIVIIGARILNNLVLVK